MTAMRVLAERGNRRLLVEVRPGLAWVFDLSTDCFVGQPMHPEAIAKFGYWTEAPPEATERVRKALERWERRLARPLNLNACAGRSVTQEEPEA